MTIYLAVGSEFRRLEFPGEGPGVEDRTHGGLGDLSPAVFEAAHCLALGEADEA